MTMTNPASDDHSRGSVGLRLQKALGLLICSACLLLASSCGSTSGGLGSLAEVAGAVLVGSDTSLTSDEIALGLKEALSKGSQIVVDQVGQPGGYEEDSDIHIPLPDQLIRARKIAGAVGLDDFFADLETRMNRAAEVAAPKARSIFLGAIQEMTLSDANGILRGPDDAATRFFERTTSAQLRTAMRPLIDQSLAQVGAINSLNQMLTAYRKIPLAPRLDADLTTHVLNGGLEGMFFYIAQEEKAIRDNPLKRSSELLRRVFGSGS